MSEKRLSSKQLPGAVMRVFSASKRNFLNLSASLNDVRFVQFAKGSGQSAKSGGNNAYAGLSRMQLCVDSAETNPFHSTEELWE
jgi:hypothetical protein